MVEYSTYTFKAMGSTVTVQAELSKQVVEEAFQKVEECFKTVEKIASRFDENSELSFINDNLLYNVEISAEMQSLLKEAYHAYQYTGGCFDPRILTSLTNAGYANTFKDNKWSQVEVNPVIIREPWHPNFGDLQVRVGAYPIDLGGIGKSYTAWKASEILTQYSENFFINAGGDAVFKGVAPEGTEWTVGVDNPYVEVSTSPLAIIALKDQSVATSSIAKRSWVSKNGTQMHHIINPKTGLPADNGIVAVTVIHEDVVTAEVWSKSLFLETINEITTFTESMKLPVLWFTKDNQMHYNKYMKPYITWTV